MSEVQTLARGLKIIQLLAERDSGISVTEIAGKLELDKSSVSRMVQTLSNHGFAKQDDKTRHYKLGETAINLSEGKGGRLARVAKPLLERLTAKSRECSHIAVFEQGRVTILCDVESNEALRVVPDPKRPLPLHATALGKCLLAFTDISVNEDLKRCTDRTILNHEQLKLHLEQVRLQGFALDDEENEEGIRCLAAPLYGASGQVIASIGISGPAVRVTPKEIPALATFVKEIANEISLRIGGSNASNKNNFNVIAKDVLVSA